MGKVIMGTIMVGITRTTHIMATPRSSIGMMKIASSWIPELGSPDDIFLNIIISLNLPKIISIKFAGFWRKNILRKIENLTRGPTGRAPLTVSS